MFDFYISGLSEPYVVIAAVPLSDAAEDRIESFAFLEEGWDYGFGGPTPEGVREAARGWVNHLRFLGFISISVAPGSDGEVSVGTGYGDHYLEVIIEADGSYSVAYDIKRQQQFYRLNQSFENAQRSVWEAWERIWRPFISSIPSNTIQSITDSTGSLLGITEVPYQYAGLTVLDPATQRSVNIFSDTLAGSIRSLAIPLYSGSSTPKY